MPNPDSAWHAESPGTFIKVDTEAFYLKFGGETKLLFEQLKEKSRLDKVPGERHWAGKEYYSGFIRIKQLLVLLHSSSTFPVFWVWRQKKKNGQGN